MSFEVRTTSLDGTTTAVGAAGDLSLVVGAGGQGFNGGQLLYLAVAGCVSNDLYREARRRGITLTRVEVIVRGDFTGDPAVSTDVSYDVAISGDADEQTLRDLVAHVDAIAEIPNSLRRGTRVTLGSADV
jgi:putative redox protein